MGATIRIGGVIAAVIACAASASQTTNQPTGGYSGERFRDLNLPPRQERVEETERVNGFVVEVVPIGIAAWRVDIANETDDDARIDWDQSTFVTVNGESGGRLLRGETKKNDSGRPQPPTTIAPHARMRETVLVEKFIAAEGYSKYVGTGPQSTSIATEAERGVASLRGQIAGGHLRLKVETAAGRVTWVGTVESTAPKRDSSW